MFLLSLLLLLPDEGLRKTYAPDDARINCVGRYDAREPKAIRFGYPGSGFVVRFSGTALTARMDSDTEMAALTVVVDAKEPMTVSVPKEGSSLLLAGRLSPGTHTAEVYKRTESWQGILTFRGLQVSGSGAALLDAAPLPARKLLFVGDSVTCGAGIDSTARCEAHPAKPSNDGYHAYGMELGRRLNAQAQLVCYGGRGVQRDYRGLTIGDGVLNAPDFLDLAIATDAVETRAPWSASRWTPDAVIVSLGTNDFNRQKTQPLDGKLYVKAWVKLLLRIRAEYPVAFIFATEGAIVTDPLLRQYVQEAVTLLGDPRIAWVKANHYAGDACDAHPTRQQHMRIADDLEPELRKALGW